MKRRFRIPVFPAQSLGIAVGLSPTPDETYQIALAELESSDSSNLGVLGGHARKMYRMKAYDTILRVLILALVL